MATSTGDAKARVEVDLTKALNSFAVTEEDRRRSEVVITRLEAELTRVEAERASLLLELEASKVKCLPFMPVLENDREDMVKDYQGSLELIFAYGYRCYVFKNNICGDRSEILDGMPDSANPLPLEFFVNPRCPLSSSSCRGQRRRSRPRRGN